MKTIAFSEYLDQDNLRKEGKMGKMGWLFNVA